MSTNRIEVSIGARIDDLLSGLNRALSGVRNSMGEMSREVSDNTSRMNRDVTGFKDALLGVFAGGAIASLINGTRKAITEAEASFRGLEAVANHAGSNIGESMQVANRLASDGLITTSDAAKSLQNLLSRGYDIGQAEATLNRLKDAAAYNRASHLSMSQAVLTATEGLKNENSTLVDNAGVTKNVAKMWEEYADRIGVTAGSLTQAQKIQAEFNGIMTETEAQVGNAAKAADGMQGSAARLDSKIRELKENIGQALIPAFTAMANTGAYVVDNVLKPMLWAVQSAGIAVGHLAANFSALWDAISNTSFDGLEEKLQRNRELADQMRMELAEKLASGGAKFEPLEAPSTGGAGNAPAAAPTKAKKGAAKSRMGEFSAELATQKADFGLANGGKDFSLEQERAYWQKVLDGEKLSAADRASVRRKLADTRLAILRKEQSDEQQIKALEIESERQRALEGVEVDADAARQRRELGEITKLELLQQEQTFAQRRLDIDRQALAERLALLEKDPNMSPVERLRLLNQIEEMERQHQEVLRGIRAGIEVEEKKDSFTNRMETALSSSFARMMTTARSFKEGIAGVFQSIYSTIAGKISEIVAKWIMGQFTMTAATTSAKAAETTAVVSANAAQAASGAAASQASIPYVGPALAIGAAAAMLAFVSGFATKSAAGGYDIPAGVNPVVQTHAEEMILPAKYANVIRKMAGGEGGEGGAAGGGAAPLAVTINATDANSVRRLFENNGHVLARVLKEQLRDFVK